MKLSVVICTHNPHPDRLRRTLLGLRSQTLASTEWETLLVNNASARFPDAAFFAAAQPANFAVITEPELGLTAARKSGLRNAQGDLAVLVDDDNILAPDYLEAVAAIFAADARLGAAGGKSQPEFDAPPPAWAAEFFPLLALRDLGEKPLLARELRPAGATRNMYPDFAPIGAGMALRRAAWQNWLRAASRGALTDRRGSSLSSSGDNEIVLEILQAGWSVGYFPKLSLTHLIPAERLSPDYLARLNRGIQESWMQVLFRHGANPWRPLTPLGARLRQARAWFTHRAWSFPVGHIRWQGACGHFAGRVASP